MRIANIIMTHKNSFQLERLIRRMEHPQFDIYIHLDKKTDIRSFEYLMRLDRVFFIKNRTTCTWGGFSFVNAITESIREVLMKDETYEFFNLLSGQDYPIKPIDHMYRFLKLHKGKNFISFEKLGQSSWWKHAISRYELYHFTDINIRGRYFVQRIVNNILPKRRFPLSYQLYGSPNSSWWSISKDCAEYVVDYLDRNPKLNKFMKLTWGADEFLYPTIIMNSPFREKTYNNNLRYISWEEGKPNPRILDFTHLNSLKSSDEFIARKFDINVNFQIFEELDRHIESLK